MAGTWGSVSGQGAVAVTALREVARRVRRARRQQAKRRPHWVRVVMDQSVDAFLSSLPPAMCDAVEISGTGRRHHSWKTFTSVQFPEFDLLAPSDIGTFDVVICEQVLEHVADPWRAAQTLADLCRPGGHVVVSTPFMLRIHPSPEDHWRFTPSGLRTVLSRSGLDVTHVDSWGNTLCIRRNHRRWAPMHPWHRLARRWTLRNDHDVPQVVWAFAQKPSGNVATTRDPANDGVSRT